MHKKDFLALSPNEIKNLSLAACRDLFINSRPNKATRTTYRSSLDPFVDMFANQRDQPRPAREITSAQVQFYVNDLYERQRKPGGNQKAASGKLSPYTIRKDVKVIKLFFNDLVRWNILETSPASNLPLPRISNIDLDARMATAEEVDLIIRVAFGDKLKYAVVLFFVDTGCRAGEVANLQLADLDIANNSAIVTGKGKTRTAFFGEECATALKQWLAVRPPTNHQHVFCNGKVPYQPFQTKSISKVIWRLARKAGIKRSLHAHSIRHYRATHLIQNGVDVKTAADAIGDTVEVFIKHYVHTNTDAVKAAVKATAYRNPNPPAIQPDNVTQVDFKTGS